MSPTTARPSATPRERFRGALLGHAVGDALGAPAQFLSPEQITERWGVLAEMVGGGPHNVAPGQTTDATDMMLTLAESLGDCGQFYPADVLRRYLAWFESGPDDVSLTVRTVMLGVKAGTTLERAARRAYEVLGRPTSCNASLQRCVPVALLCHADPEARRDTSLRESQLTHFDQLAGWSCVAYNDLVAAAIDGAFKRRLLPVAANLDEEDSRVSSVLREAAVAEPEEVHCSAFVLDTLRVAVWAVVNAHSFEEAVVLAVNRGNDPDTAGAVTGALAGAMYGERAIPDRWLDVLAGRARIAHIADRLAELAGIA